MKSLEHEFEQYNQIEDQKQFALQVSKYESKTVIGVFFELRKQKVAPNEVKRVLREIDLPRLITVADWYWKRRDSENVIKAI